MRRCSYERFPRTSGSITLWTQNKGRNVVCIVFVLPYRAKTKVTSKWRFYLCTIIRIKGRKENNKEQQEYFQTSFFLLLVRLFIIPYTETIRNNKISNLLHMYVLNAFDTQNRENKLWIRNSNVAHVCVCNSAHTHIKYTLSSGFYTIG